MSPGRWLAQQPGTYLLLCVDHFWQKCSAFNTHHHLFIQVLIKKITNESFDDGPVRTSSFDSVCMKANQTETMLTFNLREQKLLCDLPCFCSTSVQAEVSTGIVTRDCFQLISSSVVILNTPHLIWGTNKWLTSFFVSLAPVFPSNLLWAGSVEMTEQNTPSSTNKGQDAGCKRQWRSRRLWV